MFREGFGKRYSFISTFNWPDWRQRWETYLKKSSLQKSWPFRAKHLSVSWMRQSLHWRHLACHVRSATFKINRSRISSWQPPHFGIVAKKSLELVNLYNHGSFDLDPIELGAMPHQAIHLVILLRVAKPLSVNISTESSMNNSKMKKIFFSHSFDHQMVIIKIMKKTLSFAKNLDLEISDNIKKRSK